MTTRHGDKVRRVALSGAGAAKSALAASWSRSLLVHGLDPENSTRVTRVTEPEYQVAREQMGQLVGIASQAMDRLFTAVGGSGCSVVLTDRAGLIIERRGAPGDDSAFQHWGLWTGVDWSEAREGTNGIGTCVVEQRPVVIHRDEHFYANNAAMSCMGAPIFDHEGELAGVLDISSCRADLADAFVALLSDAVSDAARRVETENFQAAFAQDRVVMAGASDNGPMLLALDQDDLVIGATRRARRTLGLSPEHFAAPRPARDILGAAAGPQDLAAAERSEIRRALAHAQGNASRAARDLGISRATLYRRMAQLGLR
ncbi:MAG: sigma-54-dependent Fis family transcriptional regulator [Hyphomonadaceae bacterium]|nr:sigma-54-dependent Fis family transcriptional regulator [Hyphomonadaceae bacterium]